MKQTGESMPECQRLLEWSKILGGICSFEAPRSNLSQFSLANLERSMSLREQAEISSITLPLLSLSKPKI
jgi:hypothetical protein